MIHSCMNKLSRAGRGQEEEKGARCRQCLGRVQREKGVGRKVRVKKIRRARVWLYQHEVRGRLEVCSKYPEKQPHAVSGHKMISSLSYSHLETSMLRV